MSESSSKKTTNGLKVVDERGQERDFYFEVSKHAGHLWKSHLERHLAIYELYKLTKDLPGSIGEFGVYHGATFFYLARLIEIFNSSQFERYSSSSHHLYGFDTFEGIPSLNEIDQKGSTSAQKKIGGFSQPKGLFKSDFEVFKRDSGISDRLHLVEGDACKTFPAFLSQNPGVRFRFVLMDFDIYEPTKAVLDLIYDYMVPGGIIAFDEYAFPEWAGETKAVDEFLSKYKLKLHCLPIAFAPSAYTIVHKD
jgi:hypothetical protein